MADRRFGWGMALAVVLVAIVHPGNGLAQGPTIEGSGTFQSMTGSTTPGSSQSLLGPMPGSISGRLGVQPGSDELFFGRLGPSAPRVPTSIMTPGGVYQGPPQAQGITAPQPIRTPKPPFYGTLEIPTEQEAMLGPPDGLTLDQAIDRLVHQNLDLLAKSYEIPQARADILTASLRGNPILFGDGQLVPYGSDSVRRPDGPTQYDFNVSQPFRLCTCLAGHRWRAREPSSCAGSPVPGCRPGWPSRICTTPMSKCWRRSRP